MARLVSLPSGEVFAQRKLDLPTPIKGSNLSTEELMAILNTIEHVGKSEAIGAIAGSLKGKPEEGVAKQETPATGPVQGLPVDSGAKPPVSDSTAENLKNLPFFGSPEHKAAVEDLRKSNMTATPKVSTPEGAAIIPNAPQAQDALLKQAAEAKIKAAQTAAPMEATKPVAPMAPIPPARPIATNPAITAEQRAILDRTPVSPVAFEKKEVPAVLEKEYSPETVARVVSIGGQKIFALTDKNGKAVKIDDFIKSNSPEFVQETLKHLESQKGLTDEKAEKQRRIIIERLKEAAPTISEAENIPLESMMAGGTFGLAGMKPVKAAARHTNHPAAVQSNVIISPNVPDLNEKVQVAPATRQQLESKVEASGVNTLGQVDRQMQRTAPAERAATFETDFQKMMNKIPAATAVGPTTQEVTSRPIKTYEELQKQALDVYEKESSKPVIAIPEKLSYGQLVAMARGATRPADQQAVLAAFDRATGKPPPKNLVEMYNGDNEIRAMAMLQAAFPAKASEPDAYTRQEKLAKITRDLAAAQQSTGETHAKAARESLDIQKARQTETETDLGTVQAKLGNLYAKGQQYISSAANDEEKTRRQAEVLELEKAGIAAVVEDRLADAVYKIAQANKKPSGHGGGKKGAMTEAQKYDRRTKVYDQAIGDIKDEMLSSRDKVNKYNVAKNKVASLTQALRVAMPLDEGRIRLALSDAQADVDTYRSDPEAQAGHLTALQTSYKKLLKDREGQQDINLDVQNPEHGNVTPKGKGQAVKQ